MPNHEAKPFTAEEALWDICQQHPDIPDDQLLEEAKLLFKQHAKPKAGRGVYKKDLKQFKETYARIVNKPFSAKDALAIVYQQHGSTSHISDDQLLQEAKYLFKQHAKPKEGTGVYKKDVKEFRDKVSWQK